MSTLSCFLTRERLYDGDRAVLFLLARVPSSPMGMEGAMGAIYPSDHWTPITLHLFGTITSTHAFEPDDNPALAIFLTLVLPDWIQDLPAGKNPIHEPAVDAKNLTTFDAVQEAITQGRLMLQPLGRDADTLDTIPVAMAYVKASTYLHLSAGFWRSIDGTNTPPADPMDTANTTYGDADTAYVTIDRLMGFRNMVPAFLETLDGDPFNNVLRNPKQPYDCSWAVQLLDAFFQTDKDDPGTKTLSAWQNTLMRQQLRLAAFAEYMAWANITFIPGYIASEDPPKGIQTLWDNRP